jgi:hypothetical protein
VNKDVDFSGSAWAGNEQGGPAKNCWVHAGNPKDLFTLATFEVSEHPLGIFGPRLAQKLEDVM